MPLGIESVDTRKVFDYVEGDETARTEYNVHMSGTLVEMEDQAACILLIKAHASIPNETDQLGTLGVFCTKISNLKYTEIQHSCL